MSPAVLTTSAGALFPAPLNISRFVIGLVPVVVPKTMVFADTNAEALLLVPPCILTLVTPAELKTFSKPVVPLANKLADDELPPTERLPTSTFPCDETNAGAVLVDPEPVTCSRPLMAMPPVPTTSVVGTVADEESVRDCAPLMLPTFISKGPETLGLLE